jgi:hypothetical protein
MLELAGVVHDETDGLPAPDRDLVRSEAHGVGHLDGDGARDLGCHTRFADGLGSMVMASGVAS